MTDDIDLSTRQLCPDGACIGVIGPDGRCKVCGRAGEGPYLAQAETEPDSQRETETETETALDADAETDTDTAFSDEQERELCPDGACIGVIGSDGRCKVCGRAAGS